MSSKGPHRIAVTKHVYLRTQQRRLRHVKSVVIRNLSLTGSQELGSESLNIGVYFTLHPLYNEDKILYRSEPVYQSYNPSWESVQFTSSVFGKHSSLSIFTIKVWFQPTTCSHLPSPPLPLVPGQEAGGDAEGEAADDVKLAFEGTIDLSDLVYLGALVNKDGSGYPSNSVVIGMFEGYYSNPAVGGTQAPPSISHSLVDLLPPRSLLEVSRTEVLDSYLNPTLQRILLRQEVLNKKSVEGNRSKAKVQAYLKEQEAHFKKKRERERLKMKVALLRRQVQEQEKLEKEKSEGLKERGDKLNSWEAELRMKQEGLRQKEVQYQLELEAYHKHKEMLEHARKSRTLRQRNMIYELTRTFFINEVSENSFTICKVILPNSDQLDQTSSMEQCGVALGYAAHLVNQLGHVLQVPLQYPIKHCGSRSTISDHISEEVIIDTIKEFPLYLKGTEKALFQYAVHLLNKDIGQLRQHCGYGGSRGMLKKTLPSLKNLLDKLVKDYFLSSHLPSSFNLPADCFRSTSEPTDANSSCTLLDRERFRGEERLVSPSLHNLATNATLGLSPTSAGQHTISPKASLDHESYHSVASAFNPLSTPLPTGGSGLDEGGDVVVTSGRDDRSSLNNGSNTSMEDGFQGGFFRSRSNHVGSFQHPSSETLTASLGSSTHEQLHYSIPTTPTSSVPADNQWRKGEGSHQDSTSALSDTLPCSTTRGRGKEESSGIEGGLPEFENGVLASVVDEPSRSCTEPSPSPTTSSQEQEAEKHFLVQELIPNPLEREPDTSEWESEQKGVYKFVSSSLSSHKEGFKGGMSGVQGDGVNTVSDDTDNSMLTKDYNEGVRKVMVHGGDGPYSAGSGDGESGDGGDVAQGEECLVAGFDPSLESSLDFGNRRRCGPLVGSKEFHNRWVLAKTKEHAFLPPSPPHSPCTHSVVFTASGFSRLSPDTAAMSTTACTLPECIRGTHMVPVKHDLSDVARAHMIPDRQIIDGPSGRSSAKDDEVKGNSAKDEEVKGQHKNESVGNGHSSKDNGGKGHEPQSDRTRGQSTPATYMHAGLSSASLRNVSSVVNEVSVDRSISSPALDRGGASSQTLSSHSQLTGRPRPQVSNSFKRQDPSSMAHGSFPSWTTSSGTPSPTCSRAAANFKEHAPSTASLPPPTGAPTAGLIMPPQVSVFQHPPGYLLKHVGVSTPHVVGRGEEEGEAMTTSTLVSEGSASSTGHTHQGVGNTGRDTQFLEDFIDGF